MASAFVAALASFIFVGLGQIYNGQMLKGLFMMILSVMLVLVTGPFLVWIVWIASVVDAYHVASSRVTIEKEALKAVRQVG